MDAHEKKHILIIDDSEDIQDVLRTLLESKGHTVECSTNGADAIHLLDNTSMLPDLILVDLRMPTMDGTSFLRCMETNQRIKNIPTVMMSGSNEAQIPRIAEGAFMVLSKPLSMSSVMAAVNFSNGNH